MKVLLIVDLQNDFCPGGSLAVDEGDKIVPVVNALMNCGRYDLIVASKDWHPRGHVSFAETHGLQPFSTVITPAGKQALWPMHCVAGTKGAELHPALDRSLINKFVLKGELPDTDSYSAFFDNSRKHETELRDYLNTEALKIHQSAPQIELDLCGLALDFCVQASAVDAADLGYATSIVLDATRSVSPENDLELCRKLSAEKGIEIVSSRELLADQAREVQRGIALCR